MEIPTIAVKTNQRIVWIDAARAEVTPNGDLLLFSKIGKDIIHAFAAGHWVEFAQTPSMEIMSGAQMCERLLG
ncbi:hypothetical protein [Desulfocurvibacter africanus]|uniref:hypothetical protein n=1 Tax=Desulfocurvibacter africanus TaxID=873 RepID=UPI0012687F95|nr:hypothetical protein [Desulfocurvibacter africanus]